MRAQDQYTAPIIARITDKWFVTRPGSPYIGQWVYSWWEQYFNNTTGVLEDNPAGRIGEYDKDTDAANGVLTDKNTRSLPINAYVLIDQQGVVNGQPMYQTATTSQVDVLQIISGPDGDGRYLASVVTLNKFDEFSSLDTDATRVVQFTLPVTPPDPAAPVIPAESYVLGLLVKSYDPIIGDYDLYTGLAPSSSSQHVFKVTGSSGGGGYPWTEQTWNGSAWVDTDPAVTGSNLRELNNNALPLNILVVAWQTEDQTSWYCQYEVGQDPPPAPQVGCGLAIEDATEGQKVVLDLTEVVGDGITWDQDLCSLNWRPGCGMVVGPSPIDGEPSFTVNLDTLAGDNAYSSLVVHAPISPAVCEFLAVDLETASSTTETVVTNSVIALVEGKARLTQTKVTYENEYNAAGLLLRRTAGSPVETYTEVDICLAQECCDAEELTAECTRSPSSGTVDETEFSFTVTPTGGVPPYEYYWDFGDGLIAVTQNPTHTYAEAGEFSPQVTVTDACGNTVVCGPGTITVTGAVDTDCCPDDSIPTTLVANFSDGTGDLACLEGAAITLTWNGTNWINEDTGVSCGGCDSSLQVLAIQCGNVLGIPTWKLQFNGWDSPSVASCDNCDPFGIRFDLNLNNGACVGTVRCVIGTDPGDCTPPFECDDCNASSPATFDMTFSGCTGQYLPLNGVTLTFAYDATVSAAEGLTIWSATVLAVDGSHKICLNCVPPGSGFSVFKVNYPSYGNWDNGAGTCDPFCFRIVGMYWSGYPDDGMAYLYTSPEDPCS